MISNEEEIITIKQNISSKEAEELIERLSGDYIPRVQKKVYYPYYWFFFKYMVKTLFGRKTIHVPCIVDSLNRQAATVDEFVTETCKVEKSNIINAKIEEEEALKLAQSYVIHAVMHKLKSLLYPELELIEKNMVFKPYWILKCSNRKNEAFKVMVDGVTGKYQILSICE